MLLNIRDITLLFQDSDRCEDESAGNECQEPPDHLPNERRTDLFGLAMGDLVQLLGTHVAERGFLAFESLQTISHLIVILLELQMQRMNRTL